MYLVRDSVKEMLLCIYQYKDYMKHLLIILIVIELSHPSSARC